MVINKKARTDWNNSNISYQNYQDYLDKKTDRFKLTLIDLFYISNFKGGNATINEPEDVVEKKLKFYTEIMLDIDCHFSYFILSTLSSIDLELLHNEIKNIFSLIINKSTKIKGFSFSYLSALLNAYFPNLIPILDRRVLINLGLVTEQNLDSQRQVKKIENFFPILIDTFYKQLQTSNLSLRELDRKLFIQDLPDWAKSKPK